jgi:translin
MDSLNEISQRVRQNFDAKQVAREAALRLSREVIQASALAIRAIHRSEFDDARAKISAAGAALGRARTALSGHPDILYAGFVHDAAKEFAEASQTYAVVLGQPLPDPEALGVEYAAYLNALGETVGELRRHLLDHLRHGEVDRCERWLDAMDEIYSLLVTIDYPDAMTGGLRRTTDVTRGILEKTRGDFTIAVRQRDLEMTLRRFEAKFNGIRSEAESTDTTARRSGERSGAAFSNDDLLTE